MSAVITAPPPARLAPDRHDWLAGNRVRGCSDADMLAVMRDKGFDEQYVRAASLQWGGQRIATKWIRQRPYHR